MIEQTIVRQIRLDLNGMVWCNTCNIAMRRTGGEYSCANAGDGKCYIPSIGAEDLLTRVMTKVAERIAASGAADHLVEDVQETTQPAADTQRNRLFAAEHNITTLGAAKLNILREVEERERSYSEAANQVNEINNTVAGLAYESLVARDELDRLEFILEEDGIRHTVGDPGTYLDSSLPHLVQELLELLVKEVRVMRDQAVVVYHDTISIEEQPEEDLTDRIPLN